MMVYKQSTISGKVTGMNIDVTTSELDAGAIVIKTNPRLTQAEKEFIICGITPEEWSGLFKNKSTGNAIGDKA